MKCPSSLDCYRSFYPLGQPDAGLCRRAPTPALRPARDPGVRTEFAAIVLTPAAALLLGCVRFPLGGWVWGVSCQELQDCAWFSPWLVPAIGHVLQREG